MSWRRLRSVLVALLAILPVTLVLAITEAAGVGLALLPAAAVAGLVVSPPVAARGAIKAGIRWGLVVCALATVTFVVGQTIVVELAGGYFYPRFDTSRSVYVLLLIVETAVISAVLVVPMSILGMAWAVISHSLERYLHPLEP